jgi:hypothetical protein
MCDGRQRDKTTTKLFLKSVLIAHLVRSRQQFSIYGHTTPFR